MVPKTDGILRRSFLMCILPSAILFRSFVSQPKPSTRRKRAIWAVCLAFILSASNFLHAQDVLTQHYDFYRSGVQSHETQLTPASVLPATFGKVFSLPVDGQVYAEPLWVGSFTMADGKAHNVLFVATEHDSVYAFDAAGKNPSAGYYWHVSLLGSGETTVPSGDTQTTDIVPEIGITSTPVIDRTAGVIYVLAKSKRVSGGSATYYQRLHALSLATGQEMMSGPVVIDPSVSGNGDGSVNGTVTFNALTQNQRAGLALSGGSVWITWASHGDNPPYHGWVLGFNASNLTESTGVFNNTPNGSDGGIWMSGGGISVDASGNLYLASGNGTFDANTGGLDYGDTAMKLTPSGSSLSVTSSFTPYTQSGLSGGDLDFGTSACTLIDNTGATHPHLLVTSDKSGVIYLLNRDALGGYRSNSNNDIQDFSNGNYNIHASFAFFNNRLYLASDGGPLSAWSFNPKTGLFNTTPITAPDSSFGCSGCDGSGATPSISANGTADAIVWVLDNSNYGSSPAVLHAFDQTLATEFYNSTMAANNRDQADVAVKFTTPTIANGLVYVGGDSSVTAYGLLKNAPPTVASPVFSPTAGTETGPISVSITDATEGATIHYTLDGGTPTSTSSIYTKPIPVTADTSIQAMATALGLAESSIVQANYLFGVSGNIFSINAGFIPSILALNGSAQVVSSRLRLTDGGANEAGSGYYHAVVPITNFTTNFDFQLSDASADGMTFVLQNQGSTALGPNGSGLGYGASAPGGTPGISPSAAIKFDLYDNEGEGDDSTGFYTAGASPTIPAVDLSKFDLDLHSGHIFAATISYNGVELLETVTDIDTRKVFKRAYPVNLEETLGGKTALAGFTAGTGELSAIQDVLDWSWSVPVVESFAATSLTASTSAGAPAVESYSDASFPAGKGVLFPATAAGQSVSFTVDVATSATYALTMQTDTGPNRGVIQLAIDGKNFGETVDSYSTTATTENISYGSLLLDAGTHTFRFTVVGKPKASTGFGATFGKFTLTP
jgi:hypothetical protein